MFDSVIQELIEVSIARGESWHFDAPTTTATGRKIWVHVDGCADKLANGLLVSIHGTIHQIRTPHTHTHTHTHTLRALQLTAHERATLCSLRKPKALPPPREKSA